MTIMKLTHFARLAAALVLGLLLTVGASAQTSLNTTTVSTAIPDATTRTLVVASATGATAATTAAFVDGELMAITAVSGTSLTVNRGSGSTRARAHAANAFVYIGPLVAFTTVDQGGSCTAANQQYTPSINISNGNLWTCTTTTSGSSWMAYQLAPPGIGSLPRTVYAKTRLAANSYTILPTDTIVALSTTGTGSGSLAIPITTWTLPSHLGVAGKVLYLKDESGGVSATTFIAISGTVDGVGGLLSIVALKTAYGGVSLYAGSGGWFTLACMGSLVCQ